MPVLPKIGTGVDVMSSDASNPAEFRFETYSQEGEDIFLRRMMQSIKPGFYVDVGAHHPYRFSNTYVLYQHGWRGINIDPNPGTKELFDQLRPNDINLDAVVSERDGDVVSFDIYKEPAFNSAIAERRSGLEQFFSHTVQRSTVRLDSLLKQHLPTGVGVDLLSIDVEGLDLSVLRSNDWVTVRPAYVMTETVVDLRNPGDNDVVKFMQTVGYRLRAYLYLTAIFFPNDMKQF